MSAAELLRQAIEDAPDGLRVEEDHYGDWRMWDADDVDVLMVQVDPEIARLLGLLLAAAPHLADLLRSPDRQARPCSLGEGHDCSRNHLHRLMRAIEEAAR